MLSVTDYPEEALVWCGPATAQMIMDGYPSGKCFILQDDIWLAIQSYKVETMWDTDPVGLKEAMKNLCPPAGTWVVYSKTDPQELMFSVAYWMTKNNYPVAGLLNTLPHNSYTAHTEHWVAIRGIIADKDPTTNSTIDLKFIWFNDPAVPLGDPSLERFVSGSIWYSEFQPVIKAGSSYAGKYVAIIEPPDIRGRAIAPIEVLKGRIIPPEQALRFAARWIDEYKLYENETYKILKKAKPLEPLLVNKNYGGYYIIPYSLDRDNRLANAAVIINAYKGNFQEVGVFKPIRYLSKKEAAGIALKHFQVKKPEKIEVELIYPVKERVVNRYFPLWNIKVNDKKIMINRQGKIFTKLKLRDK
jgi:hypothetical protein